MAFSSSFKSIVFDYDSQDRIAYIGQHPLEGVSYSNPGWYVKKFTYDANSNIIRIEGPLKGPWQNKESLSWR